MCFCVFGVHEAWAMNRNCPARGSMSRHHHESYRFLKTHYRFCGVTHLHWHKMEGGRGSLKSKKDRGLGDQEENRFDGYSGLTGVIPL